ncbi:MAG: hypothetical protein Cons2KO_13120 [Congregibacter sp.]
MNTLMNPKPMAAAIALAISSTAMAGNVDPHEKADDTQITMSGTMTEIDGDEFVLNYGDGTITIELEDWKRDAEDLGFTDGAEVTVFGEIDNDLFTASTIEAEAIYFKPTSSYYYAKEDADQQTFMAFVWSEPDTYELSDMTLRGRVVSTEADDGKFTIAVGNGDEVTVSTASLDYNPLQVENGNPVDMGDYVRVGGRLDYEFFDGKVLKAESVSTIYEDYDPS